LTIPAAAVLAFAVHPVANYLTSLCRVNENVRTALEGVQAMLQSADVWTLIFVLAIVPAFCEEIAFRGFVLSGLRHIGNKWRAIIISALFFGFAHGILQQAIFASLVGTIIAFLAVQSGSLLPGIIFHAIHNSLALLNSRVTPETLSQWHVPASLASVAEGGGCTFSWPFILASCVVALLLLAWFARLPCAKSPEELLEQSIVRARKDRQFLATP
jgi:sodium transport system permease protein